MKSTDGILAIDGVIPKRAFSIFSGGLDSTLASYKAAYQFLEVIPIFFDWGQKASKEEWKAVCAISSKIKLKEPVSISVPINKWDTSSLTQGNSKIVDPNNFIVYERNLIFISMAASYARAHGGGVLVVGFNKDDAGYDTSAPFVDEINILLNLLNKEFPERKVALYSPLIETDKTEIIQELKHAQLFEMTYSCYASDGPCGKCPACIKKQKNGG